jgi:hypothetical protein
MIHGPNVDLRLVEPDDLPALARWLSEVEVSGEFERFDQTTPADLGKELGGGVAWYLLQTKEAVPVGYLNHGRAAGRLWIGFTLLPEARGRASRARPFCSSWTTCSSTRRTSGSRPRRTPTTTPRSGSWRRLGSSSRAGSGARCSAAVSGVTPSCTASCGRSGSGRDSCRRELPSHGLAGRMRFASLAGEPPQHHRRIVGPR